jgi:hypothetical protein
VTTVDGTAQLVTVTIHGTDDAPNDFRSSYGDSFHFKDQISTHQGPGASDLAQVNFLNFTPASISHPEDAAAPAAPPTPHEAAQPAGQPSADNFSLVHDHTTGGVVNHVPHDLMP